MANRPGLTAISEGFTISSRWDGSGYLTGRFPQTIDVREAKKLRAWLDKFIAWREKEQETASE